MIFTQIHLRSVSTSSQLKAQWRAPEASGCPTPLEDLYSFDNPALNAWHIYLVLVFKLKLTGQTEEKLFCCGLSFHLEVTSASDWARVIPSGLHSFMIQSLVNSD